MMGSCCCVDIHDSADVIDIVKRKARVAHTCSECGDAIQPDETYEHVSGCWDGHWSKYKTCSFCLKIRDDFFDCGWFYGRLREDFRECNGFDYASDPKDWEDDDDD